MNEKTPLWNFIVETLLTTEGVDANILQPIDTDAVDAIEWYYLTLGVEPKDIVEATHLGNPNPIWDLYHFSKVMGVLAPEPAPSEEALDVPDAPYDPEYGAMLNALKHQG